MVLKQKFAIGLCLFYVVSVIGIALSMHFCGGKLADVSLYSSKTSCKYCKSEPADKKDDGCCKNTKVDVKVKDSHQVGTSFKLPKLFSSESYLPTVITAVFKPFVPKFFSKLENKAPPRLAGVSFRVLYCVFRN